MRGAFGAPARHVLVKYFLFLVLIVAPTPSPLLLLLHYTYVPHLISYLARLRAAVLSFTFTSSFTSIPPGLRTIPWTNGM